MGKSSEARTSGPVAGTVDESANLDGMVSAYSIDDIDDIDTTHLYQPIHEGVSCKIINLTKPNQKDREIRPSAQVQPFNQQDPYPDTKIKIRRSNGTSKNSEDVAVEKTLKYIEGKTKENETRKQSLIEMGTTLGQKEEVVVEVERVTSSRNSSVRFKENNEDFLAVATARRRSTRNDSVVSVPSQRGRRATMHCMSVTCQIV